MTRPVAAFTAAPCRAGRSAPAAVTSRCSRGGGHSLRNSVTCLAPARRSASASPWKYSAPGAGLRGPPDLRAPVLEARSEPAARRLVLDRLPGPSLTRTETVKLMPTVNHAGAAAGHAPECGRRGRGHRAMNAPLYASPARHVPEPPATRAELAL